jgi:hypothetical protein
MTFTEKNRIIDRKNPPLALFFERLKFRLCGLKYCLVRWISLKVVSFDGS